MSTAGDQLNSAPRWIGAFRGGTWGDQQGPFLCLVSGNGMGRSHLPDCTWPGVAAHGQDIIVGVIQTAKCSRYVALGFNDLDRRAQDVFRIYVEPGNQPVFPRQVDIIFCVEV